jgi:hypothetical protein
MRYLTIGFGLMVLSSGAVAQVWTRDLVAIGLQEADVYLTPTAERKLKTQIASDFAKGAQQAGFSRWQTSEFAEALRLGTVASMPGGAHGYYVAKPLHGPTISYDVPNVNAADVNVIPGGDTPSVRYLFSFTSKDRLNVYLQKFSTIKLNVEPVPPRDYSIVINGDNCRATEKGEYKVLPGVSTVQVTRPPKPSCEWSGSIAEGATQLVACKL